MAKTRWSFSPLRPMNESPAYQRFILDRDKTLEVLHSKAQYKITDELGGALQRVMEIVSYWYSKSQSSILLLKHLDSLIDGVFIHAQKEMVQTIHDLRRFSYVLAHAGEVEAIARATGKPKKVVLNKARIEHATKRDMPSGGSVDSRVKLYLDRIKRDILDAVQLAAIQDETLTELQERLLRSFPDIKYIKREPKHIFEPRLRESDPGDDGAEDLTNVIDISQAGNPSSLSQGFIDDDTWQDMLDDFKTEYVPKWRGPDSELDVQLGEGTPRYAWELEREMTQDFVQQVRNGEQDAAKENNITDFIWIAVVDKATDECCLWRDGLTTSEIELELKSKHADDECEATNPPLHFKCRCKLAPATEDLQETPDSKIGDFTAWLDQTNS